MPQAKITLDDFVLSPRRVHGKLIAERLADGATIEIDVRMYDRTPLTYRGRPVWGHCDATRSGICAKNLYEAVKQREEQRQPAAPYDYGVE